MTIHSRALVTPLVALATFITVALGASSAKAARTSPRGFRAPQCTWWVDRRCEERSWSLKFTQDHGRDAGLWPKLLVNGKVIEQPTAGCMVVFAPWPGGPVGHVAYVESVMETDFTISHTNYGVGLEIELVDGATIRRAMMRFDRGDPSRARFDGSDFKFHVTFIDKL